MSVRPIEISAVGQGVAANIRRLRQGQRLTCVELAERLASTGRLIPVLGIRRIERHERRVDVDDLAAFAQVFGVTPADLLGAAPECQTCRSQPPTGYRCLTCGKDAR